MDNYRLLLNFSVFHNYFNNGICKYLRFDMLGDAAKAMRNFGMHLRVRDDGFSIYIKQSGFDLIEDMISESEESLSLKVAIFSNDPYFSTYSSPNIGRAGPFSFDIRKAQDGGRTPRLLHEQAFVSADDVHTSSKTQAPGSAGAVARAPEPLALLTIALAPDAAGLIDRSLSEEARSFCICFDAAQLPWKYLVSGSLQEKEIAITDLDDIVVFDALGTVPLSAGQSAKAFLSASDIPMREVPSQRFQLKQQTSFGEKIVIKRMPNARVGTQYREVLNGREMLAAEIFINQ